MIEVVDVTKRYGQHLALDRVSFKVDKGEILGFLGPNGAGKSTTMNIIAGYLPLTEGTVTVDGLDVLDDAAEVRRKIGYLPEVPPLYGDMTVDEYYRFVSRIKFVPRNERKSNIDEVMERVQITNVRKRLIRNLSKGYRQRVGLGAAMIGNPEVLILDEPTVGLDPKQIIEIRNLIKELGKTHTVILSSHILPEVSAVCERIVIINQGRIVASDTPENLSARLGGGKDLVIRVPGQAQPALDILAGITDITDVEVSGEREPDTVDLIIKSERDIRRDVFSAFARAELPILTMKPNDLTLEEIFIQVTSQEGIGNASSLS
ncbi:MAG: ATP-binding cassette domain-containing protein [Firmicutes bacterium]|jgi:ABC-2 type transport system ATP-binding protein|nr:ATP-binding cassette domain-containing protein [Bacillota bacterium]